MTATDEAGVSTVRAMDGLGRLTSLTENGILLTDGVTRATTTYGYDNLGNLTSVTPPSGFGSRSFTYTSLGRLWTANNPESGAITYTYDGNGNLKTRTDARSIVTTFTYSALNQVKTKTYTGGTPEVDYSYDHGRLTQVSTVGGSTYQYTAFDGIGRVTGASQITNNVAYPFQVTYTASGQVSSLQYPSGRKVATASFDAAGRPTDLSSGTTPPYVSNAVYTPHGALQSATIGTLVEQACFNSRLQQTAVRLGSAASSACANSGVDPLNIAFTFPVPATTGI